MKKTNEAAFTLLELLVAVAITLILAGIMLVVVSNVLSLWRRTQHQFAASAQAKLVLDMLERDLHSAIFRRDGSMWMAVTVSNSSAPLTIHGWLVTAKMKPAAPESLRLVPDPGDGSTPVLTNARFGVSGAWLRFVTTNVESDGSLPVTVSYQIARRPVSGAVSSANPADVRYSLFRSAVSTAATFSTGYEVEAAGYGSTSITPAASRSPKTVTNPNSTDALATNVVDFGIWLYVRDDAPGALRRFFPADGNDLVHEARGVGLPADGNRMPQVVDVMIRIVSDEGASLLSEMENDSGHIARPADFASDAEWWWSIVEKYSKVYVRRIEVKGEAL